MKEAIKHNAHLLFSVAVVVELPIFKVQLMDVSLKVIFHAISLRFSLPNHFQDVHS